MPEGPLDAHRKKFAAAQDRNWGGKTKTVRERATEKRMDSNFQAAELFSS